VYLFFLILTHSWSLFATCSALFTDLAGPDSGPRRAKPQGSAPTPCAVGFRCVRIIYVTVIIIACPLMRVANAELPSSGREPAIATSLAYRGPAGFVSLVITIYLLVKSVHRYNGIVLHVIESSQMS
jgi:hypothetical protein